MTLENIKFIPLIVLIIGVSAIIAGAMALTLSSMTDTLEIPCVNSSWTLHSSGDYCTNNTAVSGPSGTDSLNLSDAAYALYQGQEGVGTTVEQLPTMAIIAVMVIIIGVIVSVFAYFKYFY